MDTTAFECVCGTVAGRRHTAAGRGNQDRVRAWQYNGWTLLAAADGVSTGAQGPSENEHAAELTVHAFSCGMQFAIDEAKTGDQFADTVREVAMYEFGLGIAREISPETPVHIGKAQVHDRFCAAFVGASIGPEETFLFGIGHGYVWVDLAVRYRPNRNPWSATLAHLLLPGLFNVPCEPIWSERVITASINSVIVGSDGIQGVIDWAMLDDQPLANLLTDSMFGSPDAGNQFLQHLWYPEKPISWHDNSFSDDGGFAAGRRVRIQ